MPGIVWYLLLAVIGLGVAAAVIARNKDSARLISYFLFATLVADTGEILVMLIFKSYSYHPGVSSDPMVENIVGHIIPNSTFWPGMALLATVYALRYRWIILIAVLFMFLDVLYVRLGLYTHNWWRTYMTGIAIFAYCAILQRLLPAIESGRHPALRYIMFSGILCTILLTPSVLLLLAGKESYRPGMVQNPYRDGVLAAYLIDNIYSLSSVYFLCVNKHRYRRVIPFVLCFTGDVALSFAGILRFSGGWNLWWAMAVHAICLLLFIALEDKYRYSLPRGS